MIPREPGNVTNSNLNIYKIEIPINMWFLVHGRKFYQILGNRK